MIKFFRKIRQQMLKENRVRKYLLYAIGEIILVVVGILIALSINNSNERRKSNLKIELLKSNLVEAINEDIDYLKFTAAVHEFRFNSFQYMLKITGNTPYSIKPPHKYEEMALWKGAYPDTINRNFLDRTLVYSGLSPNVVINRDVIDELKSIGLFSSITNESLKKAINAYYSFVGAHFEQEDWNERLTRTWREYLRDNFGVLINQTSKIDDFIEFVKSNEMVLVRMKEMIEPAAYRSSNASNAISLAEDILKLINGELK